MIADDTLLLRARFEDSLDLLRRAYARAEYRGAEIEVWTFDDRERRDALRRALEAAGARAVVRSALKPLLHAVLEEIDFADGDHVFIRYPVTPDAPENRFRLEAYPVAELLCGRGCELIPALVAAGEAPSYEVAIRRAGETLRAHRVFAPNIRRRDHTGEAPLTPTGWLRIRHPERPELDRDEPLETDCERAFLAIMDCVAALPWSGDAPLFNRLEVRIAAPFRDAALPVGHEHVSMAEAMHEEVYFSILEALRLRSGGDATSRAVAPGQIAPMLSRADAGITVEVRTAAHRPRPTGAAAPPRDLSLTREPLTGREIEAALDALGGERFAAVSRLGWRVEGRRHRGAGPGVFLSAGQHANEPTGPVGALRAAPELIARGADLALAPMKNPEGLALCEELYADWPTHMNHAARYTSGGDDLEYVDLGFEKEIYRKARALTGADLHVNLHGYPAREWVRPFSGYLPRDFAMWSLPKGFLLLLRHGPGRGREAQAIVDHVAARLAENADISALTRAQLARYERYAGSSPFETRSGFPFLIQERADLIFPLTLITEAPDETVHGDDFAIWTEAQRIAAIAAYEAVAGSA
ncbi:MAG: peptidase M14 [Pseudomonadota bacterium]